MAKTKKTKAKIQSEETLDSEAIKFDGFMAEDIRFDGFMAEAPESRTSIRMKIPSGLAKLISLYQARYKKRYGRMISKQHVIWKLSVHGAQGLIKEAHGFNKL